MSVSPSVPWIDVVAKGSGLGLDLRRSAPMGPFEENVTVRTPKGAINLGVSGEVIGAFNVMPIPIILDPYRHRAQFDIVATGDSVNLPDLEFRYDTRRVQISYEVGKSSGGARRVTVTGLTKSSGPDAFSLEIVDRKNDQRLVVPVFQSSIPDVRG